MALMSNVRQPQTFRGLFQTVPHLSISSKSLDAVFIGLPGTTGAKFLYQWVNSQNTSIRGELIEILACDIRPNDFLSSEVYHGAKWIVSTRHPLWALEAIYNSNPERPLTGRPEDIPQNFHSAACLNMLRNVSSRHKMFIIDDYQVRIPNELRRSLQKFLDVEQQLTPFRLHKDFRTNGGVNICQERFFRIRQEVSNTIGIAAANVVLEGSFLDNPNITVSTRPQFEDLVDLWKVDPCPLENDSRKGLNGGALLHGGQTDEDISPLLDFGVIGFPKTATTTLLNWLARSKEIDMYSFEVRHLGSGETDEFVKFMRALRQETGIKRGYKAPRELVKPKAMKAIQQHWPDATLVVGVRHPIKWWESYYNFRKRLKTRRVHLPDLANITTAALPVEVRFHNNLANLGKTNTSDLHEHALLGPFHDHLYHFSLGEVKNKIFLYEISQLSNNQTRNALALDLSHALGLQQPLDARELRSSQSHDNALFVVDRIDVCHAQYQPLRHELLKLGAAAAEWIQRYFMIHPDVIVSSPESFRSALDKWSIDPCNDREI